MFFYLIFYLILLAIQLLVFFFFYKQKTAYEMRISDWSSDVCSSDLVADAIARRDMADLKDELGDLLLQVVFHARMAEEAGLFDLADVATAISDKMERRHPHIFGDRAEGGHHLWEEIKAEERAAKGSATHALRSEEHTSELQSLMRISYAVFCL